ncbi:MAG: ferredoxin [Thermoguttaceae bacterium]
MSENMQRREFLKTTVRTAATCVLVGGGAALAMRRSRSEAVWQIDPKRCTACGGCAVNCVLPQSAVKCFHNFSMCGYCDLCTGFFDPQPIARNAGAENQLCPTAAINRKLVEDPYYEYTIDRHLCIGCGKCVDGCVSLGNGSLYLQIDQDICDQCHQCAIAARCPADAISRIPAEKLYQLKGV